MSPSFWLILLWTACFCLCSPLAYAQTLSQSTLSVSQDFASLTPDEKYRYYFDTTPEFRLLDEETVSPYPVSVVNNATFPDPFERSAVNIESGFGSEMFSASLTKEPPSFRKRLCEPLRFEAGKYLQSLQRFYQWDTAANLGLALGGCAILANTSMDENFNDWYMDHLHSSFTNDFSNFVEPIGDGNLLIPAVLAASLSYRYLQINHGITQREFTFFGEVASRSARSMLVGFPLVIVGQKMLGAARPEKRPWGSDWKFYEDSNAISGHAFMGAIPFLVAGQMCDNPLLKASFFAGSTFVAWSRLDTGSHYLSQIILGWYIAYLSTRAVTLTENPNYGRGLTVFPVLNSDMCGIGILYKR